MSAGNFQLYVRKQRRGRDEKIEIWKAVRSVDSGVPAFVFLLTSCGKDGSAGGGDAGRGRSIESGF